MVTLRARMLQRDAGAFVGRADELAFFDRALAGEDDRRIVHLVGEGGIGKSALLREVERRAQRLGLSTSWIDGREVAPFPQEVEQMVHEVVSTGAALIVFDSYELMSSLDGFLRDIVLPELPADVLIVLASRQHPSRVWFDHGWDRVVHTMRLEPLDPSALEQLASAHGAEPADIPALVSWSHGSPLAVVLGAARGPADSVAELVERLLGDEHDPAHSRVLSVAAIARITTPELLADALGDDDPTDSFKWLASRSFTEPLAEGVALHALLAEAVRERVRRQDPHGEGELRRRVAEHLHRRAVAGHRGMSTELQYLVTDSNVRWGFAGDVGSRFHIDHVRDGDADEIGSILDAVGVGEWWSVTNVFFEEHPEYCGVARTPDGRVGGYFVAVSSTNAPPAADADPLLGPWLRYARDELTSQRAVIWRDAVDLTGEMGEVTSLLGVGGLLSTGIANPRYGFLPISPTLPAAVQFAAALDAQHVAELDVRAHGQVLECHIVDFGERGLLGFQRDWIFRETGAPAPADSDEVDPGELLKLLRDPDALTSGPIVLGRSPSERLARLRSLVERSLAVFGHHRDDQLARQIISAAYLGDNAPHEAIARQLHLSRSAYFRRLHSASQRVAEELTVLLRDGH